MTLPRLISVPIFCLASLTSIELVKAGTPDLKTGVPIEVIEPDGMDRWAEPTTFPFPLGIKDNVRSTKKLIILDSSGKAVPAQFRVTQRWNSTPTDAKAPIRWLLIDMHISVAANEKATYTLRLRHKGEKRPKGKRLRVKRVGKDPERAFQIRDRSSHFRVDRSSSRGLTALSADRNGDGKVQATETLLAAFGGCAFVLTDREGAQYSSANSETQVSIEEWGRMRVVFRIDGSHMPVSPEEGIGRDFLRYTTRYTFYVGKPFVRIQHTLKNSYLNDPLGSIGFSGYRFQIQLPDAPEESAYQVKIGLQGDGSLSTPPPVLLYQDSDGGDHWSDIPDTTFRGFRVFGPSNEPIAAGDQAAGYISVHDGTLGLILGVRDFFENYPKGLEFDAENLLKLHLFPEHSSGFHWLDDGQQKTTEFLVALQSEYSLPASFVLNWLDNPIVPHPTASWIRATRAWADQGDLDISGYADDKLIAEDHSRLQKMYTKAFEHSSYNFGWSEFGEPTWAKNTHTTGSPRNKLTFFDKWALTGSSPAFRMARLFAEHSRDLRTYHIDGFSLENRPGAILWEALPPWSHSPDQLGRDQLDPTLQNHREGIPEKGHGWNAFDWQHMVVDDLYEHYLMTGDRITLDSLQSIGEVMRTWPIYDPNDAPGSTRGIGWSLRSLVKIYQVTGDRRYLDSADALVESVFNSYGKETSPINGLVYHYVSRHPPHAGHMAEVPYEMPWQMAVAIYGLMLHHRETDDPRSLTIAIDVADYMVDYGWNGVAMNESLDVDDHTNNAYKGTNKGVNLWIPSALALVYREYPRAEYLLIATDMYDSCSGVTDPLSYSGYTNHHWWHGIRSLIQGN